MEAIARARYIRIGPRKLRILRGLVLKKEVKEAIQILQNTSKKGAGILIKVLKSSLANANKHSSEAIWKVKTLAIDEGPAMKRFRAAAMGKGVVIKKRTSHVTVVIEELKTEGAKNKRKH